MDEQKNFRSDTGTVYRTGGADCPKKCGAVLPVVLMCIIVLIGVVRMCGGLRINVLRQLDRATEDTPIVFSAAGETAKTTLSSREEDGSFFAALGFAGEAVSDLWQAYYRLPEGLIITEVTRPSDAASKGISQGDVLVGFQGQPVTDPQGLNKLLKNLHTGDVVEVSIYRNGQQYVFPLTLGQQP